MLVVTTSMNAQSIVSIGTENRGPHSKILIVAEGYTSSEQSTFNTDAAAAVSAISGLAPFSSNLDKINFYKSFTVSNDSGQSRIAGGNPYLSAITLDTYWDVYNNKNGMWWYLGFPDAKRTLVETKYGNLSGGNKVFVIIICNKNSYGGYGDLPSYPTWSTYNTSLAVANVDSSFAFLVNHEFAGHSFGDLDDEYVDPVFAGSGDPFLSHPNRLNVKDTNPGGWYEGARYVSTGKWRFGDGLMKSGAYSGFHSRNVGLVQDRIDDEAVTIKGTSFYISKSGGHVSTACNLSMLSVNTRYHDGTGIVPHVNDYIYTSSIDGTATFNGGNLWWKVELIAGNPGDYEIHKISTTGKVIAIDECTSGGGFPR